MEKLLKYCLNILVVILATACSRNGHQTDSPAAIAFKKAEGSYQGSQANIKALEDVLKIDSNYSYALRELSVPYLKRGMPLEWKPRYDKAVAADPQTWVPMRGYLYLLFYRDYRKAIADFNASDTLTPFLDYPQGHSVDYWRGIAYLGLKDYKNSIAYWNKHIAKETKDSGEDWVELEAFLYRGIAQYKAGHPQKALENFDKLLGYYSTSAETKYYYAKILLENGDLDQGLRFLEEAKEDLENKYALYHDYVEMPCQIYLSDLEALKSEIMR